MLNLPEDILVHIFSKLEPEMLIMTKIVSKSWYHSSGYYNPDLSNGYSIMNYIVGCGNIKSIEYLRFLKCPWNNWSCAKAARSGHLELLKYLHNNGCPWGKWSCSNAAGSGHLEVLKYLHENGCPWDWRACYSAEGSGNLEVLKYLHENGCKMGVLGVKKVLVFTKLLQ